MGTGILSGLGRPGEMFGIGQRAGEQSPSHMGGEGFRLGEGNPVREGDFRLGEDVAGIRAFIHPVQGDACPRFAKIILPEQRLRPAIGWEERGVQVQTPHAGKGEHFRGEQTRETGGDEEVGFVGTERGEGVRVAEVADGEEGDGMGGGGLGEGGGEGGKRGRGEEGKRRRGEEGKRVEGGGAVGVGEEEGGGGVACVEEGLQDGAGEGAVEGQEKEDGVHKVDRVNKVHKGFGVPNVVYCIYLIYFIYPIYAIYPIFLPPSESPMPRLVKCVKLGKELPGLDRPPAKGELGQRIFENVSQQAWEMWQDQRVLLINHYGLTMFDPRAQDFLREQMEEFFFGEEAAMPEGWTPPTQGGKGGAKGAPAPSRK